MRNAWIIVDRHSSNSSTYHSCTHKYPQGISFGGIVCFGSMSEKFLESRGGLVFIMYLGVVIF